MPKRSRQALPQRARSPPNVPTQGGPMPVLDRAALEQSPLADLHAIASELSLDGYRRLRKAALIDAILERQGGEPAGAEAPAEEEETGTRRRRGRRGGSRTRAAAKEPAQDEAAPEPEVETPAEEEK